LEGAVTNLEQQREAWGRFSVPYDDAITPVSMQAAEAALSMAGVRKGDRLLDVAAGPGALSLPAARLGARVLAVDFSPQMVELLNQRARDEGLPNLEARVMDGTALEIEAGTFDVACSQLGVMLFPDRAAGLRELARVTRPGGTGVMSVFGPADRVPGLAMFFQTAAKNISGLPLPSPRESPLFCLSDPADLTREMTDAGFENVQVRTIDAEMVIQSHEEFWTKILGAAPAIAGLLANASERQREAIRRDVEAAFRSRFGSGPACVPFAFNIGIGVR
jgi:ubiquinone/menaquinone biosynthesis C-methylase UbiE